MHVTPAGAGKQVTMSQHMSPDEIRKQMAALRVEMNHDVEEFVENAGALGDWRFYVRRYPWHCVSVAALAGYLLVPRRLELVRADPAALMELAKKNRVVIRPKPEAQGKGPAGAMAMFLLNTALRSAMTFAGQKAGELLNGAPPPTGRPTSTREVP
jgi:hypothetical protein